MSTYFVYIGEQGIEVHGTEAAYARFESACALVEDNPDIAVCLVDGSTGEILADNLETFEDDGLEIIECSDGFVASCSTNGGFERLIDILFN